MAEKAAQIVIKKIKKGGHGGGHGGAWKVAYADFVTAMMCFFLVMWLMSTDEATKESISSYFNNPNPTEAWRPELKDNENIPLGNQTGQGESLLKGANGALSEDLVKKPSPMVPPESKGKTNTDGELSAEAISAADSIMYKISEKDLFATPESDTLLKAQAQKLLGFVSHLSPVFKKSLQIRGVYDPSEPGASGKPGQSGQKEDYELRVSRLVAVQRFLVEQRWMSEDLIRTSFRKASLDPESREPSEHKVPRIIEFIFSR